MLPVVPKLISLQVLRLKIMCLQPEILASNEIFPVLRSREQRLQSAVNAFSLCSYIVGIISTQYPQKSHFIVTIADIISTHYPRNLTMQLLQLISPAFGAPRNLTLQFPQLTPSAHSAPRKQAHFPIRALKLYQNQSQKEKEGKKRQRKKNLRTETVNHKATYFF